MGDAQPRAIRARLVAATNRSLSDLIREGAFREDLFFRLSVFHIHLPPLRERPGDVALLAAHFLRLCRPAGLDCRMSDDFLAELESRPWPGNVRELRNAIEHAAIVSRGGLLGPEHLPRRPLFEEPAPPPAPDSATPLAEWLRRQADELAVDREAELHERYLSMVEPPLLRAVLDECGGNRAAAAQRLGIHRATLRQKMRKYGLDK